LPAVSKLVPKSVPVFAVAGVTALVSYGLAHVALVSGFTDSETKAILENSTLPLWKSKNNVANL